MLVLSRKSGEGIIIGAGTPHEVRVVVISMCGDRVRLGINAPTGLTVNRDEVQAAIDREMKGGDQCES